MPSIRLNSLLRSLLVLAALATSATTWAQSQTFHFGEGQSTLHGQPADDHGARPPQPAHRAQDPHAAPHQPPHRTTRPRPRPVHHAAPITTLHH